MKSSCRIVMSSHQTNIIWSRFEYIIYLKSSNFHKKNYRLLFKTSEASRKSQRDRAKLFLEIELSFVHRYKNAQLIYKLIIKGQVVERGDISVNKVETLRSHKRHNHWQNLYYVCLRILLQFLPLHEAVSKTCLLKSQGKVKELVATFLRVKNILFMKCSIKMRIEQNETSEACHFFFALLSHLNWLWLLQDKK